MSGLDREDIFGSFISEGNSHHNLPIDLIGTHDRSADRHARSSVGKNRRDDGVGVSFLHEQNCDVGNLTSVARGSVAHSVCFLYEQITFRLGRLPNEPDFQNEWPLNRNDTS